MKLTDRIVQDGDWLFRWRSYAPLVLVPLLLVGVVLEPGPFTSREAERLWEACAVAIALAGLAVRIWAVGTAPAGTSERSTVDPRASELRSSGIYSILRHPLYVANGLMALGLAWFPGLWYLGVITFLATLLYYERVAAREEAFLEGRFGPTFLAWAARVPAMVPSLRRRIPGPPVSSWARIVQELHGLTVIAAGAFVLDAVQETRRAGSWAFDPLWARSFAVVGAAFVVFAVTKKTLRRFSHRSA